MMPSIFNNAVSVPTSAILSNGSPLRVLVISKEQ